MKNEHEFNAYITKSIKRMGTDIKVIKASDRFKLGMADWLVVRKGIVAAMEGKFIDHIPSKGKLLKHPVSPAQYSFLKSIRLAGGLSHVLVGVREDNRLLCFDYETFKDGNLTAKEFTSNPGLYIDYHIHYEDIEKLMYCIFGGY